MRKPADMTPLILPEELTATIEAAYQRVLQTCGMADELVPLMANRLPKEQVCLKYLYGCMPMTDLAAYPFDLFLAFTQAALRARERFAWAAAIPGSLFLSDVLFYRVNDENIEDHRALFFDELVPRLTGKTMSEAALEVNLWCGEKASYRSTDDRTASPLTVLRSCFGRCGEESVLLVSALRSVGIPARQCYAPKWSHCDDNHAWAEAYIDGAWHYFGACEPEPVSDRAWFTHAASRAMLVHSRTFSPAPPALSEEIVSRTGQVAVLNHLSRYARTTRLYVTVQNGGHPVAGALVRFEVLNYSELYPIAQTRTDEHGSASLLTGLGCLFLHVDTGIRQRCVQADTRASDHVVIDIGAAADRDFMDYDVFPPSPDYRPQQCIDEAAAEAFQHRLAQADSCRRRREDSFMSECDALSLANAFVPCSPTLQRKIADFLVRARGNSAELLTFLNGNGPLPLKLRLLDTLTEKDMTDLRADVLCEHVESARPYEGTWPDDIFDRYILSPRIGNEYLTAYRNGIERFFTPEEKTSFQKEPLRIASYIRSIIRGSGDYDIPVPCSPLRLLKTRCGSELSKHHLLIAVCRTFGIPARLNPADGQPEYLTGTGWRRAFSREPALGRLILTNNGASPLVYRQNYTIARLRNGVFQTLCLDDCTIGTGAACSFTLEAGCYRVITANRQIDGSVLARFRQTEVCDNKDTDLSVSVRESQLRSRLYSVYPRQLMLSGQDGVPCELTSVLRANAPCVLAVLDIGKEPTEHLLNEIIAYRDRLNRLNLRVIYIIREGADPDALFLRAAAAVPSVVLLAGKSGYPPEQLFCDLNLGDRRLPLSAVIDRSGAAVFAFSNYNVGTVELLSQIAECIAPVPIDGAGVRMYT